jgi:hypothetical protein
MRSKRSGVALVFFAMLVFGLMGIMAFVIDIGVASLTQAQMQNAVDTAAIEGMRLRSFAEDPSQNDQYRRPHVTEIVQMVFDDNLRPTSGVKETEIPPWYHGGIKGIPPDGPDQLNLGAGPVWDLHPGEGSGNVGETYNPLVKVYDDPVLEPNAENEIDGDMISGSYSWDESHDEQSDYSRADFRAATHDVSTSRREIGFLVRMRRSADTPIPGERSGAPTLPLLFGLGSTIKQAAGSDWNPRTDGITVRAVAIASARPVMTIGPPPDLPDLIGNPMLGIGFWYTSTGSPSGRKLGPPASFTESFWETTLQSVHVGYNLTESSGALSYTDPVSGASTVIGSFLAPGTGGSVGMPVQAGPAPQELPTPSPTFPCYFPIYAGISDGGSSATNRVIGFGYGTIKYDGMHWTVSKGYQNADFNNQPACSLYVAPGNASARMSAEMPALSSTERYNLFSAYLNFGYLGSTPGTAGVLSFRWQDIRPGTVLAPILVR